MNWAEIQSWKNAAIIGAVVAAILAFLSVVIAFLLGSVGGSFVLIYVFYFIFYFTGDTGPFLFLSLTLGVLVYALIGAVTGVIVSNLRRKKFAIFMLILIVLIIGFFLAQNFNRKSELSAMGCDYDIDYDIYWCVVGKSLADNNPRLCKLAKDDVGCLQDVANLTGKEEVCDLIDEHNISGTVDRGGKCFERFAYINQDIALCDKAEKKWIPLCKKGVLILKNAMEKSNIELCDEFEDPSKCSASFATISKNSSLCKNGSFSQAEQYDCFFRVAIETKNLETCNEIAHDSIRKICLSQFNSK